MHQFETKALRVRLRRKLRERTKAPVTFGELHASTQGGDGKASGFPRAADAIVQSRPSGGSEVVINHVLT